MPHPLTKACSFTHGNGIHHTKSVDGKIKSPCHFPELQLQGLPAKRLVAPEQNLLNRLWQNFSNQVVHKLAVRVQANPAQRASGRNDAASALRDRWRLVHEGLEMMSAQLLLEFKNKFLAFHRALPAEAGECFCRIAQIASSRLRRVIKTERLTEYSKNLDRQDGEPYHPAR